MERSAMRDSPLQREIIWEDPIAESGDDMLTDGMGQMQNEEEKESEKMSKKKSPTPPAREMSKLKICS